VKLLYHFSTSTLTNVYVVGPDGGGDAIIVDPGVFDVTLLEMVEHEGYYIRSILVTHEAKSDLRGISTILRIYDADIYASNPEVFEHPAKPVAGVKSFSASGMEVKPIRLPGYWSDALVYHVGEFLFVGKVLSAGMLGDTINAYSRALLKSDLRELIFPLPGNLLVLPTEGPPSTLEVEVLTNIDMNRTI